MVGSWTGRGRHARVLLIGATIVALVVACAWGGWAAVYSELNAFQMPGARAVERARLGPGLLSLTFSHDGPVRAQTLWLYGLLEQRGWRASQSLELENCDGRCLLGEVTLVFTRRSGFGLIQEVVTVEQRGSGPYRVRVVLRRCIRLPVAGCWPLG
jgi:hypothetical protein